MRIASWLALAVLASAGVAQGPPQPSGTVSSADEPATDIPTLIEMLKRQPWTFKDGSPLLGAGFFGDTVRLSSTRVEPLAPDTLVAYFDEWSFAARLQLLLDYASWQQGQEQPRTYGGLLKDEQRQLDEKNDRRIAALVREAGCEIAWKPFVAVYAELLQEVTKKALAYRTETGNSDPFKMMVAIEIDELARAKLEGVIENFPMDPQIVAHEMLRLLDTTRTMLGMPSPDASDDPLFHACGAADDATIVANPGHPLASAFFAAYQADGSDAAASRIRSSYREIVSAYRSWSSEHPAASTKIQLERVRGLTEKSRLVEQIKGYRDADGLAGGAKR